MARRKQAFIPHGARPSPVARCRGCDMPLRMEVAVKYRGRCPMCAQQWSIISWVGEEFGHRARLEVRYLLEGNHVEANKLAQYTMTEIFVDRFEGFMGFLDAVADGKSVAMPHSKMRPDT